MAKQPGLDFQNAKGGLGELKHRLLFATGVLAVFRIGSFIPIPGIGAAILTKLLEQQRGTIIEMFNVFSGDTLSRAFIFALGIMPYISASIVIQLLTMVCPTLAEIKKKEESGCRKISQYARYGTLVLTVFQLIGIATGLPNMPGMQGLVVGPGLAFYFTVVVSLVTGIMFLTWLGGQIIERGIGNGVSIITFVGIVAGLPPTIVHTTKQARQGDLYFLVSLLVAVLVFAVVFFVIFIEHGQHRTVVSYAKRQQGCRAYAAQSAHLLLKVNMAGVISTIFASGIILSPATIVSQFGGGAGWNWLTAISLYLQLGQPFYVLLYASAIIFFCFSYTASVFNPRETAGNLKKSSVFVSGIYPGEQTTKYIDKVTTCLILVSALYITPICLAPEFMHDAMEVPFYFGGTSLLVVIVVIMDSMAQVQTLMVPSQYESALKKANLKGYGR